MAHPLITPVLELAAPLAQDLNLEVVGAVFQTNQSPPILRVDVRRLDGDTGLDDCERMSRALEPALDDANLIPDAYVLEISSPGVPTSLSSDREFASFRGFPVLVQSQEPVSGTLTNQGTLIRRDEDYIYLNKKGRIVRIPRSQTLSVQLVDHSD